MASHTRYVNIKTMDMSILTVIDRSFTKEPLKVIHRLIQSYNNEIKEQNISAEKLETFRMILCYEFKLLLKSDKKTVPLNRTELCFDSIENILFRNGQINTELDLPIYYDIVILQLVLYCDISNIIHRLENFRKYKNTCSIPSCELKTWSTKVIHCFLEAISLHKDIYNNIDQNNLQKLCTEVLNEIKSCLQAKEDIEWKLLALILPKFIETFNSKHILVSTWEMILTEIKDVKDILAASCIMVDTYFPLELQCTETSYLYMCLDERFWLSIVKGLESTVQQFRKQALFLMKRVISCIDKIQEEHKVSGKNTIVPFAFCYKKECALPVDSLKEQYFLIMNALEEKQNHLVAPALSNLPHLIKGYEEHLSCNNCINIIWIRCILKKILQNESNAVVKWGLLYVCKIDINFYDDDFMDLFVKTLNNTFVYETDEDTPEIVQELTELLQRLMKSAVNLFKSFLSKMCEISWGPVALFYVTQALRKASDKVSECKVWERKELEAIKTLVSKNLNMHSRLLRVASQSEILQAMCNCVEKTDNIQLLANTLAAFPAEEALTKGTYSWNLITQWLANILPKDILEEFFKKTCETYMLENDDREALNPSTFAFIFVLLYDAELVLQDKKCPVGIALNACLNSLTGIDVRPYSNITSGMRVAEFMSHLMKLSARDNREAMYPLITPYIYAALKFLLKNLRKAIQTLPFDETDKYLTIIETLLYEGHHLVPKREVLNYTEKFYEESISIFESTDNDSIRYLCALKLLYFCQDLLIASSKKCFYVQALLNKNKITAAKQTDASIRGKIMSDCCLFLAKLTLQQITEIPMEMWSLEIIHLEHAMFLFEMGGQEIVPVVTEILKVLIEKNIIRNLDDVENLQSLFKVCWNSTFSCKKNPTVWKAVQGLLGIIVNSNFLELPDTTSFTQQYIDKLLEEADNMPSLKRILLMEMEKLNDYLLENYQEALLECLLHGHAPRRDKRIENQACLYILNNFKEYYPKLMSTVDYNIDASIRAHSAVLLHRIIIANPAYALTFLPRVLARLERIKNKRYFNHSHLHKIKHRIMQVLLILQPILNQTSAELLQEKISDLLLLESNQHSVRLMQEWLLIRIFSRFDSLHRKLWELFTESIEKRPGCTISVASITYHVAKLLPIEKRPNFVQQSLLFVSQCCLGQQFNMRLYNQVVLVKLYELIQESNAQHVLTEYKGLYNATIKSLKQGNLMKNAIKIQDEFYFSVFHPINDYSLETIYSELPRLSNMDRDERIPADLFESLNYDKNDSVHPLKLFNIDCSLANASTPAQFMKSSPECTESALQNEQADSSGLNDVQRKINPYKSVMPLCNDFLESYNTLMTPSVVNQEEGLVLVASLIDRAPNLGGLARTCEIFGVKKLVIANLNALKDKEFQNLSVTAEKWINIVEVKPHQLKEYLMAEKDLGYSLIGVEQTANSKTLLEMKFDKKTILVLGNEKDGVPANLIPLFDICVEVPQVGLIRSLNVHVTGAICIWQYANQHTFV